MGLMGTVQSPSNTLRSLPIESGARASGVPRGPEMVLADLDGSALEDSGAYAGLVPRVTPNFLVCPCRLTSSSAVSPIFFVLIIKDRSSMFETALPAN